MSSGIRINELRLGGSPQTSATYGVSFRVAGGTSFRPLSVIAGPASTGKSTVVDFVRYCLGGGLIPSHPEVVAAVRSAAIEVELDGQPTVIERAAVGNTSSFASVWPATFAQTDEVSERRLRTEPPSAEDGLSQFILEACDLGGVSLPVAPTKTDSASVTLSIRDMFRIMFVPNEQLGSRNLVFENGNYVVRQKYLQSIDVMFGVHNNQAAVLSQQLTSANEAARAAQRRTETLRALAYEDHPRGALFLARDQDELVSTIEALEGQISALDEERSGAERTTSKLRDALGAAEAAASTARVRLRNRDSLLDRLHALRAQYADDRRKLNFLKETERLFNPLQVVVCPVCLADLKEAPAIADGHCSMCDTPFVPDEFDAGSTPGGKSGTAEHSSELKGEAEADDVGDDAGGDAEGPATDDETHEAVAAGLRPMGAAVINRELTALSRRIDGLNAYVERLELDAVVLRERASATAAAADEAATAVDAVLDSPAPWLALRDDLMRRLTEARLDAQTTATGITAWERVEAAENEHTRLQEVASRIASQRRAVNERRSRGAVVAALSKRFGEILGDFDYPKLDRPFVDDNLIPHVRGLPYTAASSGGMVLIGLAWNLALWEVAHEQDAAAPGLLVLDSPQKNLGHGTTDADFADAELVENFYAHAKGWLAGPGAGAQLVIVDNSPPEAVAGDVVVRFTRDPQTAPYGLITDAIR